MVWVAIVAGLSSGLAGTVIGTVLTVSHQRAAEFRSRMLLAAEDLLRYGEAVRRYARHPHGTDVTEALDVLRAAWDDFVTAVALVNLLFGYDSEAARWADEAGGALGDVERTLRAAIEANSVLEADTDQDMRAAGEAMIQFGKAAAAQVRKHRR